MKEFVSYTVLRILLFVASLAVVAGIWKLIVGNDGVPLFPALIVSLIVSGVASYFVLNRQREAFSRRVEERAGRMSAKLEEVRAAEDAD